MPPGTAGRQIQDSLFGTLAVRYHFVLADQVQEALGIQSELQQQGKQVPRLGEILVQRGYITQDQVQAVLKGQLSAGPRRFGELAVALQFCPQSEVEAALTVQKQIKACGSNQRLGEILVARGALRPHQVHAVLNAQGKVLVACPGCNTRLNISGVTPGTPVSCPRCKTVFRPHTPNESAKQPQQQQGEDVRADLSTVLPPISQSVGSLDNLGNTNLGKYQLGEKLGTDSSGALYKGLDPTIGSNVAIRILNSTTISNRAAADRWISAGEAASQLDHPNLQRILSINSENNRVYLVLEFVEGESLRQSLIKRKRFPAIECVDVLIQIAEAVVYGHAHGFLHGDLRPAHVLVGFDGMVRVSGLGTPKNVASNLRQLAGLARTEALPLYTAPEVMIDEDAADERSDIYSIGAIGYQMLSGRPPHEGNNVLQVGLKVASENITPPQKLEPSIPLFLNRLICKCLQVEPDDRYDSAASLLDDLRKARQALLADATDAPEIAPPPGRMTGSRTAVGLKRVQGRAQGGNRPRLRTHTNRGAHNSGHLPAVRGNRSSPRMGAVGASRSNGNLAAIQGASTPVQIPVQPLIVKPKIQRKQDSESVDLLGDIDPLAAEITRSQQPVAPPIDEDLDDIPVKPRKPRKEAAPVEPGVSTTTILVGAGILITLVIGLIIVASKNQTQAPIVQNKPAVETQPQPEQNAQQTPVANPEASRDWRLIKEHIQANGSDYLGIVQRLENFKLKYVDSPTPSEQAGEAKELLKQYSELGANAATPELKANVEKMLAAEKFSDADKAIEKWRQQWKFAPQTDSNAKSMLQQAADKQKSMANALMSQAKQARGAKKFEDSYNIYKRISDNYGENFAEAARKAKIDAMSEADAARGELDREAREKKAAEAQAAREAAAPARLAQLNNDFEAALKNFDLDQCNRLLDTAYEALSGTPQGPDVIELRADVKRMADLRETIVRAIKGGKMTVPQVNYKGQQCVIADVNEKVVTVEAGGKVAVDWTDLNPDDLLELARRATTNGGANDLLELGMLRYFFGKYREARQSLSEAKDKGATITRYMPKVEAKIKELASKAPEPTPEKTPAATPEKTPTPPAATATTDEDSIKALAAKGLELNRGIWKVTGEAFACSQDATSDKPDLMSLKHPIKKNFKSISIEVRGTGEMAGFSFGDKRRFVIRPDGAWQKITIERNNGRVTMTVDKDVRESIEEVAKEINADNLVVDGVFFVRFKGTKGEFRNLMITE